MSDAAQVQRGPEVGTPRRVRAVAVAGLGRVGSLIAALLDEAGFEVTGLDSRPVTGAAISACNVDIADGPALRAALAEVDAVISCLPVHLNIEVARAAHAGGIHYLDLTEDVETASLVDQLAAVGTSTFITQCGLAPGYVNVMGAELLSRLPEPEELRVRVGALPHHPQGELGYAVNWSPEGWVNECLKDCEVIHDGRRMTVPPMGEVETMTIAGVALEASSTSGGVGSLCETYEGRLRVMDYKTLRYPGHWRFMRAFLRELRMGDQPGLAASILGAALPPTEDDVVYVHLEATGRRDGAPARERYIRVYRPRVVAGELRTAISWTTASSACAVLDLLARGVLSGPGRIRQEEIDAARFHATRFGAALAEA